MLPAGCTDSDAARLRGPGQLSARPLPGQRHHHGDPDRRPELGPVQRPDPVPRRPAHAADHGGPDRRWRQPGAGGEHHRPQRRPRQRHARRDVERHGDRPAGRLQGVHGLEPERAGLLAAGPHHRDAHRPARTRPRREGVRGPQGAAAGELRSGLQPPRRRRRRVAPVPRHAVRHLPRGLGPLARRRPLRPQRHHRHRHPAGFARPPRRARRTTTSGSTSPPCGASCSPRPTRRRTPWASCSAGWASSG